MAEINYEVHRHIGVLSEKPNGWRKEVNLISWNGRDPKYDIREWTPNKDSMSKGITLTEEELSNLYRIALDEIAH